MDRRFDALLWDICVRLGFCGTFAHGRSWHVTHYIPASGPVTAEQFARWVLLAESSGRRSEDDNPRFAEWLTDSFRRHMGADTVDASELRRLGKD